MVQVDLFVRHSSTSESAARGAREMAQALRERVYRHIAFCGDHGATDDEIQVALKINPSTQRPRRVELVRSGRIASSTETRPTRSGRQAVVWKLSRLDQPQRNAKRSAGSATRELEKLRSLVSEAIGEVDAPAGPRMAELMAEALRWSSSRS